MENLLETKRIYIYLMGIVENDSSVVDANIRAIKNILVVDSSLEANADDLMSFEENRKIIVGLSGTVSWQPALRNVLHTALVEVVEAHEMVLDILNISKVDMDQT